MPRIIEDDWKYQLYNEDCFETFKRIPDGSIDLVLVDPPYGTTACKWDSIIPLDRMWKEIKRVGKSNCAFVFTASQPFTSVLTLSEIKLFRYSLVWDKVNKYTGALNANKMPLRCHEDISVFYSSLPTYNKQYREGKPYKTKRTTGHGKHTQYGEIAEVRLGENTGLHNPCSIIQIEGDVKIECGLHPTQKPVLLMEYLIKTYSNEGNTVLDFAFGSGTTGVACGNLNRKFIGCDSDKEHGYFQIAQQRIKAAYQK